MMQPTLTISDGPDGSIIIRCYCGEYSRNHDHQLVKHIRRIGCTNTLVVLHGDEPERKARVFKYTP